MFVPFLFFLLLSGSAARPPQKAHDGSKDSEREGVEEEEGVADYPDGCGLTGHTGHGCILQ